MCGRCGKEFSHNHHLKTHIETVHEGLKRFVCQKCNKKFASPNALKYHNSICTQKGENETIHGALDSVLAVKKFE